ncbi:MAG: TetR/AcrR family transcriptional regulator [Pseudomonadota bacterium]
MGYSKEHIEHTRKQILQSAGRLMRKQGYEGTSVSKVMADAGLTHGGFYAHFDSKESLFQAVVAEEFDFNNQLIRLAATDLNDQEQLVEAISQYLNPDRKNTIANACTMASSAVDIQRVGKPAQNGFTKAFKQFLKTFQKLMPDDEPEEAHRHALGAVATCVGALILARAISDKDLQRDLLASAVAHTVK